MGQSKGLLRLGSDPLVVAHGLAFTHITDRVIVVLGADAQRHRDPLPSHWEVVINPDWAATGPAESLRHALVQLDVRTGCWVTPVDVPPASAETLRALAAAGGPAVPVFERDIPGHPVLLDADLTASVRRTAPEGGLRTLLRTARRVPVSGTLHADFDTPEAWAEFSSRWRESPGRGR